MTVRELDLRRIVMRDGKQEGWQFHVRSGELVAIGGLDQAMQADRVFYAEKDDPLSVTLFRDLPDRPGFRERIYI